jgi:hypothetical protein
MPCLATVEIRGVKLSNLRHLALCRQYSSIAIFDGLPSDLCWIPLIRRFLLFLGGVICFEKGVCAELGAPISGQNDALCNLDIFIMTKAEKLPVNGAEKNSGCCAGWQTSGSAG